MTAQFHDKVRYEGIDYALAGASGEGLFSPPHYGLEPVSWCTACWLGYLASYEVSDDRLLLDRLDVCLTDPRQDQRSTSRRVPAPAIEGCEPRNTSGTGDGLFEYRYENMALPVAFSGGLLLATDFIQELYVHMGFHPAWKYRTVHELIFHEGKLVQASDQSARIEELRRKMAQLPLRPESPAGPGELRRWIDECFSLDYEWDRG